jgi:hypothetical protein
MKQKLHSFGVSQFMSHIFSVLQIPETEIEQSELSELVGSAIDLFENEDWEQGFAWFPDIILIPLQSQSGLIWTEIWLAEEDDILEISPINEISLLLPWYINRSNKVFVDDENCESKNILQDAKPGWYKIIYEERNLCKDDFEHIDSDFYSGNLDEQHNLGIGPKFCKLTFSPTSTHVDPEILKYSERIGLLDRDLFLHEELVFSAF